MKPLIILLFVCLLFYSCKKQEKSAPPRAPAASTIPTYPPVSKDFNPYYIRFAQLAATKGITPTIDHLNISYMSADDITSFGANVLGVCSRGGTARNIIINQNYWDAWAVQGRSSEMEQLLFHELGHCTLLRAHENATVASVESNTQIPVSLMNAYHVNNIYYTVNWIYYINELFDSSITGQVAVHQTGTSAYPTGIYASTVKTYAMTIQSMRNEIGPYAAIEEIDSFHCDED